MSWFSSCSNCGGPGGNFPSYSIVGYVNEFVHDPNPLPYDNTPDFFTNHHSTMSIHTREPSYNQNYDDNYYPHNSSSFLCCEDCGDLMKVFNDLVPILSESEETSRSDSECILPSCDDFSPIDIPEEKAVTFSNPLFNSNDDFISSDDESLSDEDVPEDNIKIYSNPLFGFDNEYIFSDVNPLFDEVLENIDSKDSYDSNLDEPNLLVAPLSNVNTDECFDSGGDDDEINVLDCEDSYYDLEGYILYLVSLLNDDLVHRDLSIPAMSVASILEGFTDEPPLEENDDLFDLEPKNEDWKKILYDTPNLMSEEKVFDLEIHDQIFSPTYVSLPFTDRHYIFFTYVVRIFLPHFIYLVVSPFLISSGSEDTIFDLGIFVFHFSHWSGTFI
nr:hypothetical protein [Tanacetum cinerariifolium]